LYQPSRRHGPDRMVGRPAGHDAWRPAGRVIAPTGLPALAVALSARRVRTALDRRARLALLRHVRVGAPPLCRGAVVVHHAAAGRLVRKAAHIRSGLVLEATVVSTVAVLRHVLLLCGPAARAAARPTKPTLGARARGM